MFMRFKVQKTHYFPHTVHYCCSSMLRLSETCRFLQSSSFWEARCALIGQLSSALWLAEYLKRVMEMLRPSPYCDAVSRRDETKTIKPIINEAFVASSGDMITDYIKSNQIKSLLLSHHHSTSALVSEILESVLQTVQKNKTIYI